MYTGDEHSKISPSGFSRMIACPASVGESELAPFKPPSQYAERGTLQHEGVVLRWNGKPITPLGLTEDESNNVDDAIDYLRELVNGDPGFFTELHMEVRGDLSILGYPDIWGTRDVDLRFMHGADDIAEMHVIDWKFGYGVPVEVDDNPQLLGYLLMALTSNIEHNADKYFIHVVQPPKNYYECQEVTHEEISTFSKLLTEAIEETKKTDAAFNPGEKQCQFCPAAHTCKARYNKQLETAHEVFAHYEKKSPIVTPAQNSELFTKLTELISYHSSLGKHGFGELVNGREFPGYKLVSGRSTRSWKDEKGAAKWLAKYTSIGSLHAKPKMLSPAQIEKKDRALKKDSDFKELVSKPPGKPKMVADDDKRDALNPNDSAMEVFKNI